MRTGITHAFPRQSMFGTIQFHTRVDTTECSVLQPVAMMIVMIVALAHLVTASARKTSGSNHQNPYITTSNLHTQSHVLPALHPYRSPAEAYQVASIEGKMYCHRQWLVCCSGWLNGEQLGTVQHGLAHAKITT